MAATVFVVFAVSQTLHTSAVTGWQPHAHGPGRHPV